MSKLSGTVGQVIYSPDVNPPMGQSRIEVLGMPAAMVIDVEGQTGMRTGDVINIEVEETP